MNVLYRILCGIPVSKTSVSTEDLEIEDKSKAQLKGGFYYGKTLRGVPYVPPRPLLNHGPHRCKSSPATSRRRAVAMSTPKKQWEVGSRCEVPNQCILDFYQIVALSEPLDTQLLSSTASRDQIADAINGKVLGWGVSSSIRRQSNVPPGTNFGSA